MTVNKAAEIVPSLSFPPKAVISVLTAIQLVQAQTQAKSQIDRLDLLVEYHPNPWRITPMARLYLMLYLALLVLVVPVEG